MAKKSRDHGKRILDCPRSNDIVDEFPVGTIRTDRSGGPGFERQGKTVPSSLPNINPSISRAERQQVILLPLLCDNALVLLRCLMFRVSSHWTCNHRRLCEYLDRGISYMASGARSIRTAEAENIATSCVISPRVCSSHHSNHVG